MNGGAADHRRQRRRAARRVQAARHVHDADRQADGEAGRQRRIGHQLPAGDADQRRQQVSAQYRPWLREGAVRRGEDEDRRGAERRDDDEGRLLTKQGYG